MLATNPIVSHRRSSVVNTNSVNLRIIHPEPYSRSTNNENVPNQIRMQRWNRLMGQLGKTSFDFAMELQREFPDSSTVQDYFQERYRQHQQEQHYLALIQGYWQNENRYQFSPTPPSFWDTVRDRFKPQGPYKW